MIEIDVDQNDTGPMNPIALIEATAAARSAVLGALATDPVGPSGQARHQAACVNTVSRGSRFTAPGTTPITRLNARANAASER